MATYIRVGRLFIPTPVTINSNTTTGQFSSSNTALPTALWTGSPANRAYANDAIGKSFTAQPRRRIGFAFAIPASLTGFTACVLSMVLDTYENTLESWNPNVYVSNSDDSAFGSGWWNNLDNGPYALTYGTAGTQSVSIPFGVVSPRAGSYLSIVVGEDLEMTGGGAAASSGNNARCIFPINDGTNNNLVIS